MLRLRDVASETGMQNVDTFATTATAYARLGLRDHLLRSDGGDGFCLTKRGMLRGWLVPPTALAWRRRNSCRDGQRFLGPRPRDPQTTSDWCKCPRRQVRIVGQSFHPSVLWYCHCLLRLGARWNLASQIAGRERGANRNKNKNKIKCIGKEDDRRKGMYA